MKIKLYIRWFGRFLHEWITGKLRSFAVREPFYSEAVNLNHVMQVKIPILNPAGQKDIYENKIHNLKLAAAQINGLTLMPGGIFSFWHMIGPTTEKAGYKTGAVLIRGKMSRNTGGGLCQLSSALYYAAFQFGLKIIERHPHSVDAYDTGRYIPLGLDATISFPVKDLQFQNSLPGIVAIYCSISEESVIVNMASEKKYCIVRIKPEIIGIIPKKVIRQSDQAGGTGQNPQKGSDGKIVKTTRHVKYTGAAIDLNESYIDKYLPIDESV